MTGCLKLTLPPDLAGLPEARRFVGELGSAAGLSDDRIFDLKVAVSEACANAIEHASSGVELLAWLLADRVILEVTNDGPFRVGLHKSDDRRRRGLGLPLMVSLADQVHVARLPEGKTCVSLAFFVSERPARGGQGKLAGPDLAFRRLEAGRKQMEDALLRKREREQAGEARLAEQQRFYDILEKLPVMARLLTPEQRVLFANRSFRQSFGDAGDRHFPKCVGEPDKWEWDAPDGRRLEIHRFPFTNIDGAPLVLEMDTDITERTRLEAELRFASLYTRSLIEASLDPLVTIDAGGKITDVNEATEEVTGLPRAELVGTDFSDYFTEPTEARAGYLQVFRDGAVRDYPLEIAGKHGRLTPVLYNASVYRDQEGGVAGVFAAARDVSGLRLVEAALQAERQRFSDVLQMMPVYTILITPDHHVPFANRFFEERFGASKGRRCFEYLFGRTEPCETCESFTVLRTNAPHNWEWTGPDGRIYDIFDFPFSDVDGSPLVMEVGIDITERKRAEMALQEARDRLEVRVNERTAELMESTRRLQAEVEERKRREAEKERLLQEQRELAERLQSALLNVPSSIGRVRLGHAYRSATEQALVGGDFYDVFDVKGGRIGVLIGDVAGHGVEAARVATLVRDVIRAFAHLSIRPQEILRHANGLLLQRALTGFVSVFLGVLHPESGILRYCSAGHPDSLVRRASGTVEVLGSGSSPLGVFSNAVWDARAVKLEPEDLLFLYTDGVIEARRDGDFFGEERLQTLLKRQQVPVDAVPARVLDHVLAFSDGSLRDDIAILALTLTAPVSEANAAQAAEAEFGTAPEGKTG